MDTQICRCSSPYVNWHSICISPTYICNIFFKYFFHPWLAEFTDMEALDTEGQLYVQGSMLPVVSGIHQGLRMIPLGMEKYCITGYRVMMTGLLTRCKLKSRLSLALNSSITNHNLNSLPYLSLFLLKWSVATQQICLPAPQIGLCFKHSKSPTSSTMPIKVLPSLNRGFKDSHKKINIWNYLFRKKFSSHLYNRKIKAISPFFKNSMLKRTLAHSFFPFFLLWCWGSKS